ncbi:NfeD family protein [Reinekea sp.]|jgi:membrane protein implicated in regulation of membrane protease activity|uniref:NfeD family protein n=1 Tax=Reinekea sp. TaxID=1970455 RepID=UPI002A807663|nr:NfeD family protein [Reinekea sp.]
MASLPLIWLGLGIVLILLELVVPGAVLGFVGGAALLTSGLIYFGHISGPVNILLTFFIASISFVVILRTGLLRLFPSESTVQNTDELVDAIGQIVVVLDAITPHRRGRIKYSETSWSAQADVELGAGQSAVITGRDGNCFIVKPLEGH